LVEIYAHRASGFDFGNAFYEKLAFDEEGQLLADYPLPTALDVPGLELDHTVTLSPLNPLDITAAGARPICCGPVAL
jgi:CO/xanthine dehydrogenase Mo-binding subunit